MKKLLVVIGVLLIVAAIAFARPPKSDYQWTGSVVESDGDHLIVQKGDEKWEFAIDKDTKMAGTLKAGAKVTVKYCDEGHQRRGKRRSTQSSTQEEIRNFLLSVKRVTSVLNRVTLFYLGSYPSIQFR